MANDTPESDPQDSQVPFISNRNEADDPAVATDMSTTEDSSQFTVHSSQPEDVQPPAPDTEQQQDNSPEDDDQSIFAPRDDTPEPDAVSEPSVEATPVETPPEVLTTTSTIETPQDEGVVGAGPDTTGEIDQVAAASADVDPVATVAFDYDEYYGVPETPQRPIPVSERIERAEPKQKRSGVPFFVGALAAGVVGALVTLGVLTATGTFEQTEVPTTTVVSAEEAIATIPIPAVTTQIINDLGSAINPTAVAAKVVPSIVTVTVFENGTEGDNGLIGVGSGSGVVVSKDGYIITNNHVIEGATDYRVEFEDGRVYTAELVGTDKLTDLAVLQISADNLVPIDLGSVDELSLGDPAIAVGNPLGQEGGSSVSVGIISAFDRRVDFSSTEFLHGMIQTDAAINSGSSGGALVNAAGELIGITSAIGVSQAGPEGIGYAIPVDLVKRISDEIIETGDVEHPFLGVTIGTFVDEASDGATVPSGADIQTIEGTDSAAGKAGLEPGDIIVRIGDKPISNQTDLILAVRLNRVGDDVEFGVIRDGEPMTFTVTLGQRPSEFGG